MTRRASAWGGLSAGQNIWFIVSDKRGRLQKGVLSVPLLPFYTVIVPPSALLLVKVPQRAFLTELAPPTNS